MQSRSRDDSPYGSEAYSDTPGRLIGPPYLTQHCIIVIAYYSTYVPSATSTSTYSHNRDHSYSTVSTRAPATPPSEHYASFQVADISSPSPITPDLATTEKHDSSKTLSSVNDYIPKFQNLAFQNSALPANLESSERYETLKPQLSSNKDDLPPRIASMILHNAITAESWNDSLQLVDGKGHRYMDDLKTPLAEISNPLAASESSNTIRLGTSPLPNGAGSSVDADYSSKSLSHGFDARSRADKFTQAGEGTAIPQQASQKEVPVDYKGKGKAINQDEFESPGEIVSSDQAWSAEKPVSKRETPDASTNDHRRAAQSAASPVSSTNKKISEWLKEQYETKQRSGGSNASPTIASKAVTQNGTQAKTTQNTTKQQSHSPRGQAIQSLPSSESQRSRLTVDSPAERAQLLHTIISQDFAGPISAAAPVTVQSPSKDLLWHPTEYVGPPRRRSISGTSVLGLRRKTQGARPTMGKHQRQRSADLLTTSAAAARRDQGADEMGRHRKFAASADDLLMRGRPVPEQSDVTQELYAYETPPTSSISRFFSIKRRTPSPAAPASSHFAGSIDSSQPDGPFRHMIDTRTLPPQAHTSRPSMGHKRSLSGSISGMLSSFNPSSLARRKRNISSTDARDFYEPVEQPRAMSPSFSSTTINERDGTRKSDALRQANGRQSPFKMWRYPPGTQSQESEDVPKANTGAVNSIQVSQTQVVATSSPVPSPRPENRPESPFIRNHPRYYEASRALSSADTIEEAEGENDAESVDSGAEEDEREEDRRLKSLASQQVSTSLRLVCMYSLLTYIFRWLEIRTFEHALLRNLRMGSAVLRAWECTPIPPMVTESR